MNDQVAASYDHCQRVTRDSGSSFYYSFLLLPKAARRAMYALYAFMRHTDDLVDGPNYAIDRRAALDNWRAALNDALAGGTNDPILPALADVVATYDIPVQYITAAIDGAAMDLGEVRYETIAELESYCELVASMVGLACLRIWGCSAPQAEHFARRCGIAFQMTNILRDLAEDAARGRVYLPQEDLQRFDYTQDDLCRGLVDDRFRRLMRFEIERNELLFAEGSRVAEWLKPRQRRVFASMIAVYRTLLAEIKRRDGDVFSRRVRLSNWRKVQIATRCFLVPSSSVSVGDGAP